MSTDVAVIILTFNEEENIAQALQSVCGWANDKEVFVVDSHSTDGTVDIARQFRCQIIKHEFENFSQQRNWAIENLQIRAQWIFFLDADEWLPDDLKNEISACIATDPPVNGFYIKRRFIWMGKWLRRGYYPTWLLRLFRRGRGRCEDRQVNEHLLAEPPLGKLQNGFIHEDRKGLVCWLEKHIAYAEREAQELFRSDAAGQIEISLWKSQATRKRWLRYKVYNRMPAVIRPFLLFFHRIIIRGGILDGKEALIYHFLQVLWFQMVVDARYLELKRSGSSRHQSVERVSP